MTQVVKLLIYFQIISSFVFGSLEFLNISLVAKLVIVTKWEMDYPEDTNSNVATSLLVDLKQSSTRRFLTHFLLLVCFYAPWKHPRTYSFLILSEGIEKDQWHEWIGYRDQSAVYWAYIICSCLSCLFILLQIAHLWKHLQNYQVKPFLKFDLIRWKKTISFKLFFYLFINMHESPKIILLLTFSEQLKITHNRYFYKSFRSGQLILKAF